LSKECQISFERGISSRPSTAGKLTR
jgi:hypothetical protein